MASPFIKAMSTAINKVVGDNSISQQFISDNNSVGSVVKLASTLGTGIISSALHGLRTCVSFLSDKWALIVITQLYLVWAVGSRYNRLKAIKAKYGFTENPKTYQDMTVDVAQEVEKNLAEWEMPWLFELGWLLNFLATASVPILSKTIIQSGHFTNSNPIIAQQRQEDTIILMSSMMAHPLRSRSSSLVIARINEHHNFHGPMINSDAVLYLIWLFGWGPVQMMEKFGWRELEPFERHAMWIFWRELAVRMGCKYVPETFEEMVAWKDAFRRQEVYPHEDNTVFADSMRDMLLYKVPGFAKGFGFQCILALIDDEVASACRWDSLKKWYNGILRWWLHSLLRGHAIVHRYLVLPRRRPYVRTTYEKNELGLYNFSATTYSTSPFYVKNTFWNCWGPGALFNRARGFAVPGPKYFSDGVAWESMGARRGKALQQAGEARVIAQATILENAPYGYRAQVNFQPEPVVKGRNVGYGSGAYAYAHK